MKLILTGRQDEALEFIRDFTRKHNRPPTMQEIGAKLDIRSTNGVSKLLRALEKKGHIERLPNVARGLRLVDGDDGFALDEGPPSLPVVSRTKSTEPESLRKRPNGFLTVDPRFMKGADEDDCLIARAGDDGMNGDGIRKGDFLVIEEVDWTALRKDEVVAALIGEKLIARRYHFANGRWHLRPSSRLYADEAHVPDTQACYLVGRVLTVMRKLE